jgi:ribosomal protein S27E
VQHHDTPDTTTETEPCPGRHHDTVDGRPVWCHPCGDEIVQLLRGLPTAYRMLATIEELPTHARLERSASRVEPGSVSPDMDHADDILRTLRYAEDALRDHIGESRGDRYVVHSAATVDASVAYLIRRRTAALCAPWAVKYGTEVHRLSNTADHRLGEGSDWTPVPGPCPDCRGLSLAAVHGRDEVACTGCPRVMATDEYEGWVVYLLGTTYAA